MKKAFRRPLLKFSLVKLSGHIIFFLLLFMACNTPVEGCLDIRSTNFSFSADRPCDDCCTYPNLILRVSHLWGTDRPFRMDSLFEAPDGKVFRLKNARYFISNFSLTDENDNLLQVEEREDVICIENGSEVTREIIDDAVIVALPGSFYRVGSLRDDELVNQGKISFGLSANAQCLEPTLITSGDLSSESRLYANDANALQTLQWIIQKDTSESTLDTIWVALDQIDFDFEANKDLRTGKNDTLAFIMRYDLWLAGLDSLNVPNVDIAARIKENLPTSLQFIQ